MKNLILDDIKKHIVMKLNDTYGFCGLADGDNTAMINTTNSENRDIVIVIKEIDEESAKKEIETKTKKNDNKLNKKIVEGIWNDICRRSGGDHFLEGCDEGIQQEIKESWKKVIQAEYPPYSMDDICTGCIHPDFHSCCDTFCYCMNDVNEEDLDLINGTCKKKETEDE